MPRGIYGGYVLRVAFHVLPAENWGRMSGDPHIIESRSDIEITLSIERPRDETLSFPFVEIVNGQNGPIGKLC